METLWRDVRQTLRFMARKKSFTAAACLTLALGIGANTAIFSILWGVLLKPLPYADPGQLVRVSEEHSGASPAPREPSLSNLVFQSWTPSLRTLEALAPYNSGEYTVGREDPERLAGAAMSPSLFPLLRAVPAAGRFFAPEEAAEGAEVVVVLSHDLWRSRFGGRPEAIGRSIVVEGRPRRIVGVAPAGFAFPSPQTKLWKPLVVPHWKGPADLSLSVFRVLGRLKPGATPLQAAAEGTAVARAVPRHPAADLLFGTGGQVVVRVQPFAEQMTARIRPALLLLAVAVGLVLLIACANVSNLFLARSLARQRELAVRAALGAGGRRLAGQLLTESLVLALCGGTLGLFLAWGLTRAVPALAPANLPRLEEIRLDGRVLAFALAASLLYGVLSYGVSQRRREMGIRAALGATRAGIGRLVLREGLALTTAGLALGIAAALGVTRLMESLLFGVEPLDVPPSPPPRSPCSPSRPPPASSRPGGRPRSIRRRRCGASDRPTSP